MKHDKATRRPEQLDHGLIAIAARAISAETDNARAYHALKRLVLAGGFSPGEVVTLRSLAERLSIGDTPVREAIKRLISEGAFEALPNRSARVPVLERRDVQQILDLRIELEGRAAALAARNITVSQIESLEGLHAGMERALAADDAERYGELNMAFHFELYRIADNRTLATLIEALWLRMAPLVTRTRTLMAHRGTRAWDVGCAHHVALLGALQRRDTELARTAMREDLSALSRLEGYWELIEAPADTSAMARPRSSP